MQNAKKEKEKERERDFYNSNIRWSKTCSDCHRKRHIRMNLCACSSWAGSIDIKQAIWGGMHGIRVNYISSYVITKPMTCHALEIDGCCFLHMMIHWA